MAYNHYRNANPGWGTSQFQFGAPPAPAFQPQPSWGGVDYYRAHAGSPDSSLFDHAWNRVRNYSDGMSSHGVGLHEARHWHRRAYGGLGELATMHPSEIGHAAAYEAYRTWIHNSSIYEPISGDLERQREGLIGLAVAEAARLLQFTQRPVDSYIRMEASDAAAATASIIFRQSRERDGEYSPRGRSRHGSFSGSSYASSLSGEPYAMDDPLLYGGHQHRGRSHSRHRSHSRGRHYRAPSVGPFPGEAIPMSHAGSAYGGYPGNPVGYSGSAVGYSGSAVGYSGSTMGYPGGYPGDAYGQFPGSYPGPGMQYPGGSVAGYPGGSVVGYGGAGYGAPMTMPYGQPQQQPYIGQMPGGGMVLPQGGATTVILAPRRKHKHRHHRHKRSRSNDGYHSSY